MSDARQRFVEAMKLAWLYAADTRMGHVINDACDAFSRRVMESEHREGAHDRMPCLEACYELDRVKLLAAVSVACALVSEKRERTQIAHKLFHDEEKRAEAAERALDAHHEALMLDGELCGICSPAPSEKEAKRD